MTTTNSYMCEHQPGGDTGFSIATSYNSFQGTDTNQSTENARTRYLATTAHTCKWLGVQNPTNTDTSSMTWKLRKNGADGNQAAVVAISTAGWVNDTTHTDSIAAADVVGLSRGSGTGLTNTIQSIVINATGQLVVQQSRLVGVTYSTAGIFVSAQDYLNNGATEADVQRLMRPALTIQNGMTYINNLPSSGTPTATLRKNGADGNTVVTFTSGDTVQTFKHDTTHTDSIAAGDLICWKAQNTTASTGLTGMLGYEGVGATSAHHVGGFTNTSANLGTALSGSTSYFNAYGGQYAATTTEANTKSLIPYGATVKNLRARAAQNTGSTVNVKSRTNGADGNLLAAITSGVATLVEDTTHSDSLSANDLANFTSATGTVSTLRMNYVSATLDDGSVGGATTYNDSVSEALTLADSPSATQTMPASVTESMTLAETDAATDTNESTVTEAATLADTPSAEADFVADVTEALTLADSSDAVFVVGAHGDTVSVFVG